MLLNLCTNSLAYCANALAYCANGLAYCANGLFVLFTVVFSFKKTISDYHISEFPHTFLKLERPESMLLQNSKINKLQIF